MIERDEAAPTSLRPVRSPDVLPPDPVIRSIPLTAIEVPRRRIRQTIARDSIDELAISLFTHGQLQPILVRADGDHFTLIAGERRLQAAHLLGWDDIHAVVHTADRAEAYVLELVENVQREALAPAEELDAYLELMRLNDWGIRELARAVGRSPAYISKRTRIFEDPSLRRAVVEQGLPVSTAEELIGVAEGARPALVERAVRERWTFDAAREAVRAQRALDANEGQLSGNGSVSGGGAPGAANDAEKMPATEFRAETPALPPHRPAGVEHTAKQLLEMLMQVRPEDLTDRDRRLLTRLWQTIGLLARATPGQRRVLPPLPTRPTR